jgi:glycosyltransferase involved in cell wall biosynthesis
MIRVLHYIPAFGYGGIEKVVINLYNSIDKDNIQFDFLVEQNVPKIAEQIIKKNGGKIIQIPKMTKPKCFFEHIRSLKKVFSTGKYDVFHCHSLQTRPFPMHFAKKYKIKMRILHIHANNFNNYHFYALKRFMMLLGQKNSNYFIACSKRSASAMLSKKNSRKAIILNNGINTIEYHFSKKTRIKMRKKLGFEDKTKLVCCIGRLTFLKNQSFVIKLFNNLPNDYALVLLGDGEDKGRLKEIASLSSHNNIIFLGNVDNVNDYLCAADLVLMPSISEAMPLTIIEAQANGVPAIVSTAIDKEFLVNSNINRLSLDEKKWLAYINPLFGNRTIPSKALEKYDIRSIAKKYEEIIKKYLMDLEVKHDSNN